jgi:hypothetical protein
VLLAIEVVVMAILEGKRYEGYKKTGEVRAAAAARLFDLTCSCSRMHTPREGVRHCSLHDTVWGGVQL